VGLRPDGPVEAGSLADEPLQQYGRTPPTGPLAPQERQKRTSVGLLTAELYDLEADLYELENVYDTADPSLIEDLKARLEALRYCQGDGCREAEDAS
jgi:hypothetical protein